MKEKGSAFGLLGQTLGHSYSPKIHAMLGSYAYKLYEKEPDELADFLKNGPFDGLNVTIPYKKTVMPFCTELSEAAKTIGSVNTLIKRPDGTLYGDNTDAYGLEQLIRHADIDVTGKKVLVLGSGGTSATAVTVLEKLGASEIVIISRSGKNNYENLAVHADADVIVNTTPVGMFPNTGISPVDLRQFVNLSGVVDVIYNPAKTALMLQAEALGIPGAGGLFMLVSQAAKSSEVFTGVSVPNEEITRIERTLRRDMQNLVLIGMPGCGKSAIAKALGQTLDRTVIETDDEIEKRAGMTIPEIFEKHGEAYFRTLETAVLTDVGKQSGLIISTGGGGVTRPENEPLLRQNGVLFLIKRDIDKLPRDGRPLSKDLLALYETRKDAYMRFSDHVVSNDGTIEAAVKAVTEAYS